MTPLAQYYEAMKARRNLAHAQRLDPIDAIVAGAAMRVAVRRGRCSA